MKWLPWLPYSHPFQLQWVREQIGAGIKCGVVDTDFCARWRILWLQFCEPCITVQTCVTTSHTHRTCRLTLQSRGHPGRTLARCMVSLLGSSDISRYRVSRKKSHYSTMSLQVKFQATPPPSDSPPSHPPHGSTLPTSPLVVLNALGYIGFKVISSCGSSEVRHLSKPRNNRP